ncbi:MAG: Zn-dependent exopeptidase M28 [Bacteroidetes bacterium]|nr:Zn-dependent exopeptidase M28 [Bacteroidota bacterium]
MLNHLQGQDLQFVKSTVNVLCSDSLHGRGYVNNGGLKAAQFIANKFKEFGLKPLPAENSYFQKFEHTVNTFPGKMLLAVDGKTLIPGVDYHITPASAAMANSQLPIVWLKTNNAKNLRSLNKWIKKYKPANKCVVIEQAVFLQISDNVIGQAISVNAFKAACILFETNKKLTWSVANKAHNYCSFEVKAGSISKESKLLLVEVDQKLVEYSNQNVVGIIEGHNNDSQVYLTAHYDHLGRMGSEACFYGANDNASGTAMLLDLARYYSQNKPKHSIVFIAFAGEEAGLVGSKHYVENPLMPLNKIKLLVNLDLTSTGQDGIMVVNGLVFKGLAKHLVLLNEKQNFVNTIKRRGKAANSDHYWFSEKGVKSIFIYLLGDYPHYHDIYDTPDKPNWLGYNGTFKLIIELIETY